MFNVVSGEVKDKELCDAIELRERNRIKRYEVRLQAEKLARLTSLVNEEIQNERRKHYAKIDKYKVINDRGYDIVT